MDSHRALSSPTRLLACAALLLLACVPAPAAENPGAGRQEDWAVYRDPLGFEVRYPESLAILPEPAPLPSRRPPLLHRVRFLDRQLAAGETADLELPQFSVEVFAAPPGGLRSWLQEQGRIPPGAGVQPLEVPGAREALRLRDPRQLAPNELDWYATDTHLFLVIALGPEGDAMRSTFRLTGR